MNQPDENTYPPPVNPTPGETEIEALLSSLRPIPQGEFHQRMAQQPWERAPGRLLRWLRPHFISSSIALILTLLILAGLLAPNLEVLAQRIAQFFITNPPDQISIEMPVANLEIPETRFSLTVAEAAQMAGFDLKEPQFLPPEYDLVGAHVNEVRGAVTLNYHTESGMVLWITQRSVGVEYQRVSVQAVVERVDVGGFEGEYVEGGWTTSQLAESDPTPALTVTLQAVWDPQANIHFLRWQENDILYELFFSGADPNLPGYLGKHEMIAIAESLR